MYRFPPYQYKDCNILWSKRGEGRLPDSQEREVCLGFPVGSQKTAFPNKNSVAANMRTSALHYWETVGALESLRG